MAKVASEKFVVQIQEYLQRVQRGEEVVVTDQGRPVALLSGIEGGEEMRSIWDLVASGQAHWKGGKPRGASRPIKNRGKSLSDMVLEDRRGNYPEIPDSS
jgi:prevent-host-death family protein